MDYMCTKCSHYTGKHMLAIVTSSDLQKGPYRCTECGCERPLKGPDLDVPVRRRFVR